MEMEYLVFRRIRSVFPDRHRIWRTNKCRVRSIYLVRREARRAASNRGVTKPLIGRKPLQIFDPLGQRDSQPDCRLHLAG